MLNHLDLLVIVFMVLFALSLLAVALMFLVRNHRIKKVCLGLVAALGVYAGSVGIRIGSFLFPLQAGIGVVAALMSIAAVVLAIKCKDDERKFKIAQAMATAALVIGIANAIL